MLASVNIEDENIPYYIAEYIESIRFAEKLIEDNNPPKDIYESWNFNTMYTIYAG